MNKSTFLFIVISFLLLPLYQLDKSVVQTVELIVCISAISIFGISHGAIDNHLYGFKTKKENLVFIGIYVLASLLFGAVWWISPDFAFISFLIISAYHFGQSQFVDSIDGNKFAQRFLFSIWGAWLLSAFVFLNKNELLTSYNNSGVTLVIFAFLIEYAKLFFLSLSIILIATLFYFTAQKKLALQKFFLELYQLLAIVVVFAVSSPLLGFTLYFVILHSLRVLGHEFNFFKRFNSNFSFVAFAKLLFPFTFISISGLFIFLAALRLLDLSMSIPTLALIFISCLTFPHSMVMDIFYHKHHVSLKD